MKKAAKKREKKDDPADGSFLSLGDRIRLTGELARLAASLGRVHPYKPFIKTFNSFAEYEKWRKKQTHPWLV